MILTSKYELGQHVFSIYRTHVKLPPVPCTACEGSGRCELRGESFACPKCEGKKQTQATGFGWVIGDSGTIGQVEATARANPESFYDGEEPRDGVLYRYMFSTNGSGTVFWESQLYPSRKDAQAECDRRNGVP